MATPITQLSGIGIKIAEKLAKINIKSIEDLLFHLPLRYQDRTRIYPIANIPPSREVLFEARVESAEVRYQGRRTLIVYVRDASGVMRLRFFYFSNAQRAMFRVGRRVRCFGEARWVRHEREIIHPECQWLDVKQKASTQAYVPVYPLTEGLSQYNIRRLMGIALEKMEQGVTQLEELLPDKIMEVFSEPLKLKMAIQYIHNPPADADIDKLLARSHPAQERLAFEEILTHTIALRQLRQGVRQNQAPALSPPKELFTKFRKGLPFRLTKAQERVIKEIYADLKQAVPMVRLVQGDVGCGKTLVATAAMLAAYKGQGQSALMVPTETLAEQHYATLDEWLKPLGIHVCLIAGKQKAAHARNLQRQVRTGEADIVIGTHALFQEKMVFSNLVLLVIDEQHRFGVHQRLALKEKGQEDAVRPHQLIMTATPIPRSLAMTMYADLDYSVIDEMPPGRKPVQTIAVAQSRRPEVIERVGQACARGQQAYWICSLIEESDKQQLQAAEQAFVLLGKELTNVSIDIIHGRMKSEAKEQVLKRFRKKEVQLLVATTVIEVGVDIPSTTLIIIENAERFGLAQLHQLRGRVGRGQEQATCVLLYDTPLGDTAKQRLDVMRRSNDGFEIAREDMRIRGAGEMLGTRQTGAIQFRIANPMQSSTDARTVCKLANQMLSEYPQQAQKLIQRWIGETTQYVDV